MFGTTKSIASAIPLRSRPKDSGMSLELYALGARCEYVCIMCKVDHAFLAWSGDGPTTRCPPLKLAGSCTCDQAPPRAPACRAPGSIGGVLALSPSLLIPGRAAFCSLCCQIYPRRSGFCLHLAPSCWYLSRPTLLPLVHSRNDSACSCSVRLIDSNRSFALRSVLSALLPDASGLADVVAQTFASIPAPGSCSAA